MCTLPCRPGLEKNSRDDDRKGSFLYWDDAGAFSWRDYTLSVNLRTSDDDGIGVMFRYVDPGNYYKVDLDRQRNFRKLFRMAGGVESTLAAVPGGYLQNADLRLQVAVAETPTRPAPF